VGKCWRENFIWEKLIRKKLEVAPPIRIMATCVPELPNNFQKCPTKNKTMYLCFVLLCRNAPKNGKLITILIN